MGGAVSDISFVDGMRPEHIRQPHAVYVGYIDDEVFTALEEEFPCNDAGLFLHMDHMERMKDDDWGYLHTLVPKKVTAIKSVDEETFKRCEKWLENLNKSYELLG
jgi:hypothetical protein